MKIKIGPYKNFIGPYQIAEKILFWIPKYDDNRLEYTKSYDKYVYGFGDRLSKIEWLTSLCLWIESKRKRKIKIKIDKWDTWSMDHTLAFIILPMLNQLRDTQHGSPIVELEDVPESMRTIDHEEWEDQICFEFYHDPNLQNIQCDLHHRWDWVLNEMIWAFERIVNEEDDLLKYFKDGNFDSEKYEKDHARMQNGLRLFGKYYRGLWD